MVKSLVCCRSRGGLGGMMGEEGMGEPERFLMGSLKKVLVGKVGVGGWVVWCLGGGEWKVVGLVGGYLKVVVVVVGEEEMVVGEEEMVVGEEEEMVVGEEKKEGEMDGDDFWNGDLWWLKS